MLSNTFAVMLSAMEGRESKTLREGYDKSSNIGYVHPIDKRSKLIQLVTNTNVLWVLIVGAWLLIGMIVYVYSNNWTWYNAFYYCVNAGLSIGFGDLAESFTQQMHAFTIGYVLCGSSIVSGAFGYFLSQNLFPSVEKSFRNRLHVPVTEDKGMVQYYWDRFKTAIGWYSNRGFAVTAMIFMLWMALGTIYGMCYEGWPFVTALYFAVTSCSTAGLLGPPCNDPEHTKGTAGCDFGMNRAVLVGLYALFGVPLYAFFLGQFGMLGIGYAADANAERRLHQQIKASEFAYACTVLSTPESETLLLGEFILLELMRLGITDSDQIDALKARFYTIAPNKANCITVEDMLRSGLLDTTVEEKDVIFVRNINKQSRTLSMVQQSEDGEECQGCQDGEDGIVGQELTLSNHSQTGYVALSITAASQQDVNLTV